MIAVVALCTSIRVHAGIKLTRWTTSLATPRLSYQEQTDRLRHRIHTKKVDDMECTIRKAWLDRIA